MPDILNGSSPKKSGRSASVSSPAPVKLPAIGRKGSVPGGKIVGSKAKAKPKGKSLSDEKKRAKEEFADESTACRVIRGAFDAYAARCRVKEIDRAREAAAYAAALAKAEAEAIRSVDVHEARKKDAIQIARERRRKLAKEFLRAAEVGDDDTVTNFKIKKL